MYEASIQCWFYIGPPAKRHVTFRRRADDGVNVGPPSDSAHERLSKSLETVFSIAICRHCGDKLQFKTLLPTI